MRANNLVSYVGQGGRLTDEGLKLFLSLEDRLQSAEAKLAAIAEVTSPSAGLMIDAEARTAINSIITAAG